MQFATVLSLASVVGFIVHRLKLPLVPAYLITGVLLSSLGLFTGQTSGIFTILPDVGVAFVLFLIGMELDLREIRTLGAPIILSSLIQIIISTLAGYSIAGLMGFNGQTSFYIGLGLAFSSTVVVVKMLLEKKELNSLYGKLSVGILLIEDLVALFALMVISIQPKTWGVVDIFPIILMLIKALGMFGITILLSKYVLEKLFDSVAKSTELLFLTAITWCFLFTALAALSSFSVVIGAFLAGVSLASSPYHLQIQGKVKPLRDFFVTLFFIYLGMQVNVLDILHSWPTIIGLTLFAVFVKPFIFMLILGTFGFRKHTFFQTAIHLSQISEFSLVILLLGLNTGVTQPLALSIMSTVAVLSIICSSIMIVKAQFIYSKLTGFIGFFEHTSKTHFLEKKIEESLDEHIVIIGAHRLGTPVINYLKTENIPFVVMDFNPHTVEKLRGKGVKVIYGDVTNLDILDNLGLERAKLIISTVIDLNSNELLIEEVKRRKSKAKIVARASDLEHSKLLRKMGADYIILPEMVLGHFLVTQLKDHWPAIHFAHLG